MLRGTGVLRRQVRGEEEEHHSDMLFWAFAQFHFDNFGFLDAGDVLGWKGREEERHRERENAGKLMTVLYRDF